MWRSTIEQWADQYNLRRGRIFFLISGPSGAGKTTLLGRVISEVDGLRILVSTTTRQRRPNEVDGNHYHFVSRQAFEDMIKAGQLLEHKLIFGDYYGLTYAELNRYPEYDVLFDMDVKGMRDFLSATSVDCVTIFLMPPSLETVRERLESRHGVTPDSVEVRLARAEEEIRSAYEYDFIVENRDLHEATREIEAVIFASRSNRDMRLLERVYPRLLEQAKTNLETEHSAS
jgi:guanylate kinase